MNHEQIKEILDNAPEGAEFYTGGYQCEYRKWDHSGVTSVVYGYLDGKWEIAIDQDIARERIDKGWYLPNLAEQLEPEQEWKNGDWCVFDGCSGVFMGYHPTDNSKCVVIQPDFNRTFIEDVCELSKPETPEQKAAREREEAVKTIQSSLMQHSQPEDEQKIGMSMAEGRMFLCVAKAIVDGKINGLNWEPTND